MSLLETPTASGESPHPLVVPLWRNRDYVIRYAGQAISILGTQVSQIAFPLLVLGLTGSPAQAGLLGAARILPYVLISLLAGALVDRWDRKLTMILCDIGRAIAMASVPLALWTGHLSIIQLYIISIVEGSLAVFFSLAATASLPRIVSREQLPAAMGQSEATYQLSGLVGPALGGVLYGIGRLVPFMVDAVSYAASVVSLLFIRAEFQETRSHARRHILSEITEGLVWLWKQPIVRTIGFLSSGAWIMLTAQQLVVIVLAKQQHASPGTIGLIFAIGAVGGITGSLLSSPIQRRFRFGRVIISCGWIWAAVWPLYAFQPPVLVLGIITAGLMVVFPVYNVTQMSYRVALIPDHLQGRVNSAFRMISFSGQPIGLALSGALLQAVGPRETVLILAVAPLSLAVAASLSPHVRGAEPIKDVRAA